MVLTLYIENSSTGRVLEPDPDNPARIWRIGRNTRECQICPSQDIPATRRLLISSEHARLRYEEDSGTWQVYDTSTNGTWVRDKPKSAEEFDSGRWIKDGSSWWRRLPQRENSAPHWYTIQDGDSIWFGVIEFVIYFVYGVNEDTVEVQLSDEDTVGKPAEAIAAPQPASSGPWYAEIILLVLNGPANFPSWLWWIMLLLAALLFAMFYAWVRYGT